MMQYGVGCLLQSKTSHDASVDLGSRMIITVGKQVAIRLGHTRLGEDAGLVQHSPCFEPSSNLKEVPGIFLPPIDECGLQRLYGFICFALASTHLGDLLHPLMVSVRKFINAFVISRRGVKTHEPLFQFCACDEYV